ncbi:unnamed protein product [Bemisia tabaci]|uniref:Uncharacterized protein n=1 Tax=Bemisia tabaci TaxID=7038 RepID=A0A9P0F6J0_BEMTA|nr:unnamed protein product [Bemisia tabaci]
MNTSRIASQTARSPVSCGQRETHSAYMTAGILHALRQTHGRRETHSAYMTAGMLHALRQSQCDQRGAAAEVKIIKPHLCLFFHNFLFHFS